LRLLLKTQIFSEQFVPRQSSQNHVLTGGGIAHSVLATSDLNNLKLGSNTLRFFLASREFADILSIGLAFENTFSGHALGKTMNLLFPFCRPSLASYLGTLSFCRAKPCWLPTLSNG
jgi:hypothetical protein